MSEKKGRAVRRSDRPQAAGDLRAKRAEFVQTFFQKGAALTEELVRDNARLREENRELARTNAKLKAQLAKDRAVRDLLKKIEELEEDRGRLLSSVQEAEEVTSRFSLRFMSLESELESFATLYVASDQLHATLDPAGVVRQLSELLLQLVGAQKFAVYAVDSARRELVPIVAGGLDGQTLGRILLHDGPPNEADARAHAQIERAFLTGELFMRATGDLAETNHEAPAACVPMRLDGEVVGVVVVHSLLEHKRAFVAVDRELFKLLSSHAAPALTAALLFARSDAPKPSLTELSSITA
jgi:hypothetical protein